MKSKKIVLFSALTVVIIAGVFLLKPKNTDKNLEVTKEITPVVGTIKTYISCTGTVLPKNRLEVKPPVNGRVESILVKEGDKVKTGQILAWMSSTERAALLDAARGQGQESLKYWEEAYKPIPLLAPIDGEVIVQTTQPGQTVTTSDAVVVLSDHLIVRAQVDETDIGKILLDKKAIISLDAYADIKIKASVEHIYYESQTVNNVTIYNVDLIPETVPSFFRSGMNASVDFIEQEKENILVVPLDAVHKDKDGSYLLVKNNGDKEPVKMAVKLGLSDDKNVEILSAINENTRIITKSKKFVLPISNIGKNPFMPRH